MPIAPVPIPSAPIALVPAVAAQQNKPVAAAAATNAAQNKKAAAGNKNAELPSTLKMGAITADHQPNMALKQIRSKYPMGDRIAMSLRYCCRLAETPSQMLQRLPSLFTFKDEFKKDF